MPSHVLLGPLSDMTPLTLVYLYLFATICFLVFWFYNFAFSLLAFTFWLPIIFYASTVDFPEVHWPHF